MEKFLEKEKEVDQQGKLFNFERPNVNNTSVDYLYIASDNTNSDRFHAAGSRRSINQSIGRNDHIITDDNVLPESNHINLLADESERLRRASYIQFRIEMLEKAKRTSPMSRKDLGVRSKPMQPALIRGFPPMSPKDLGEEHPNSVAAK